MKICNVYNCKYVFISNQSNAIFLMISDIFRKSISKNNILSIQLHIFSGQILIYFIIEKSIMTDVAHLFKYCAVKQNNNFYGKNNVSNYKKQQYLLVTVIKNEELHQHTFFKKNYECPYYSDIEFSKNIKLLLKLQISKKINGTIFI